MKKFTRKRPLRFASLMLAYSLIATASLVATSCSSCNSGKPAEAPAADMHTSENSLDFYGVYEGTIPAASAEGIQMTLQLNRDKTFQLTSIYLGKKGGTTHDSGSFTIENDIITLPLGGGQHQYYKIEEGQLVFLDQEKNKITGEFAQMYIIKQVSNP